MIKILLDTTEILVGRWEDPGDYPNAVASSPLPSYDYVEGIEGEIKLEMNWSEYEDFLDNVGCDLLYRWIVESIDYYYPAGVLSAKWGYSASGGERFLWLFRKPVVVTLWVVDIESDPNYELPEDGTEYDG